MALIPINQKLIQTENSTVTYQSEFLTPAESVDLFEYCLKKIEWKHDEAVIYGKKIITKRQIAWFADSSFDYNYSKTSRVANKWTGELMQIKNKLQEITNYSFNSCLLNLYYDGTEGMGWHSDDQNHLEPDSPVAIISLGEQRFFKLRETKNRENQRKLILQNGSLLLMLHQTQKYWQHEIPKMASIKDIRINLTWRNMSKTSVSSLTQTELNSNSY